MNFVFSDDEKRVKKFREKHAATVIQRGWRKHKKRHRNSFMNKTRQDNFDKVEINVFLL